MKNFILFCCLFLAYGLSAQPDESCGSFSESGSFYVYFPGNNNCGCNYILIDAQNEGDHPTTTTYMVNGSTIPNNGQDELCFSLAGLTNNLVTIKRSTPSNPSGVQCTIVVPLSNNCNPSTTNIFSITDEDNYTPQGCEYTLAAGNIDCAQDYEWTITGPGSVITNSTASSTSAFLETGSHTICLTVTLTSGCEIEECKTIYVVCEDPCEGLDLSTDFRYYPCIEFGKGGLINRISVYIGSTPIPGATYSWEAKTNIGTVLATGSGTSTDLIIPYFGGQQVIICLTVSKNGCSETTSLVYTQPIIDPFPSWNSWFQIPTYVDNGSTYTATAQSSISYIGTTDEWRLEKRVGFFWQTIGTQFGSTASFSNLMYGCTYRLCHRVVSSRDRRQCIRGPWYCRTFRLGEGFRGERSKVELLSEGDMEMTEELPKADLRDGTDSQLNPTEFSVFPNPTTNYFDLSYGNLPTDMPAQMKVYNAVGQQIYTEQLNASYGNTRVNLKDFAKGVYLIQVSNAEGVLYRDRVIRIGN